MIRKLNIFKYISFEDFLEDGINYQNAIHHYSLNPFGKSHFNDEIEYNNNYSYSFVLSGKLDYKSYEEKENSFIKAFEEIYNNYKVISLQFSNDKYILTEYTGFLSMKTDLIDSLREIKNIDFIIDDLSLSINCNFDLVVSLGVFSKHIEFNAILKIFEENELFVTRLNN